MISTHSGSKAPGKELAAQFEPEHGSASVYTVPLKTKASPSPCCALQKGSLGLLGEVMVEKVMKLVKMGASAGRPGLSKTEISVQCLG